MEPFERTTANWQMEYDVMADNNPHYIDARHSANRKIRSVMEIALDKEADDYDESYEKLGQLLTDMVEEQAMCAFIMGSAHGWVDANKIITPRLNKLGRQADMVASKMVGTLTIAFLFGGVIGLALGLIL